MGEKKELNALIGIGSRVRSCRKRSGLPQEKLSEQVGVTSQYISGLERGKVGLSVPTVVRLSRALFVTTDYLLLGDDGNGCPIDVQGALSDLTPEQVKLADMVLRILVRVLAEQKEKQ